MLGIVIETVIWLNLAGIPLLFAVALVWGKP
jgi:hypothetical protein